jgi:dTDP-4-dehydrorhamnose reductase
MATNIPMQTKKKILVTGANGLLGQKLVENLIENSSFEVIATGRGACRISVKGFKYVSMDLIDSDQVKAMLSKIQPQIIIHCAAITHVDVCEQNQEQCYQVNVKATEYLVEEAEKYKAHFIYVSTDFVFSGEKELLDENEPPSPVNFYGQTKWESERFVSKNATYWAIVRTVLVYGLASDLSRSNLILWVKSSLEAGKEIQVVDDQFRTPTLAEDLASGCILIAEQSKNGIFNICGSDFLTPFEMAILSAEYFGLDTNLIKRTNSSAFKQPAQRPKKTGLVIEKARVELGYEPKTFLEGIAILANQFILASS